MNSHFKVFSLALILAPLYMHASQVQILNAEQKAVADAAQANIAQKFMEKIGAIAYMGKISQEHKNFFDSITDINALIGEHTALSLAVLFNGNKIVQYLIDHRPDLDVNTRVYQNRTALDLAIANYAYECVSSPCEKERYKSIITMLAQQGADFNLKNLDAIVKLRFAFTDQKTVQTIKEDVVKIYLAGIEKYDQVKNHAASEVTTSNS